MFEASYPIKLQELSLQNKNKCYTKTSFWIYDVLQMYCSQTKMYRLSRKMTMHFNPVFDSYWYGKCPKISFTNLSDKMAYANSADPDQTTPKGAVWSGSILFAIPISILWKKTASKAECRQKKYETKWLKFYDIYRTYSWPTASFCPHLCRLASTVIKCTDQLATIPVSQ